jgi:uncharacterized membrane protein
MFLAHRIRQHIRIALTGCAVYAFVIAIIAAVFPREDKSLVFSFGWWLVAVPVGLIGYAVLESLCTWCLGLPFWQRLSSWARVLLLVLLISLATVGPVFLWQYFKDRT